MAYMENDNPVVISVNFIHDKIRSDFIYMSNVKRYRYWRNNTEFTKAKKILTSNIDVEPDETTTLVSFIKLLKCGWEHSDNSTIMLLRLLDSIGVSAIAIAGFDGYDVATEKSPNYASKALELSSLSINPEAMNTELKAMLRDYRESRKNKDIPVKFITPSRFEVCFEV